jgi:hypothetical protein
MTTTSAEIDWAEVAEKTKTDVKEAVEELQAIIAQHNPVELISRVAVFILSSNPDCPKDSGGPQQSETNLEYLVSLVAAHPPSEAGLFPSPDAIDRTIQLLTIIHMAASWHYRFKRRTKDVIQSPIEEISDSFRLDKLHVRGDGYWLHLRQTIQDLLQPHDPKLQEALGFSTKEYLDFMQRTEEQLNELLFNESETHIGPYRDMFRPWLRENGDLDVEGWSQYAAHHQAEVAQAKAKFDAYGSASAFAFRPTTQAEERILLALSCEVGANSLFHGTKPEHAFWPLTPSATDSLPILRYENTFYGFNLSKLGREAHTLIGDLLRKSDPDYWEHKFIGHRDNYLEAETARLFNWALPGAKIFQCVIYPFGTSQTSEADVVVICDDILIIVECKASRIDAASKRGANKKVESVLKSAIIEAHNQAERFVTELTVRGSMELRPKNNKKVLIEASTFNRVFRVNVTLDLISSAATVLWKLNDAGLVSNIEKCWSVSLNDLRAIVDVLDQPALFLHYISRRLEINMLRKVEARDELDYLMHYVKCGLFFRENNAPAPDEHIMIGVFTEELDQYYRRIQGLTDRGPKPRPPVGKRTQKLLSQIQSTTPKQWASASVELLEFDISTREELLGKQQKHLQQLQQRDGSYALSFTANFESGRAIAIATSNKPQQALDVVTARCAEHCRRHNLKVVWCFLCGIPISGSKVQVLRVTSETEVSESTSRLLRELNIHVTEYRTTGTPPNSASLDSLPEEEPR